jgi:hypothetical protein
VTAIAGRSRPGRETITTVDQKRQKQRLRRLLDIAAKGESATCCVYKNKPNEYWVSALILRDQLSRFYPTVKDCPLDVFRLEISFPDKAFLYSASVHPHCGDESGGSTKLDFNEDLIKIITEHATHLALVRILYEEAAKDAKKRNRRAEKILQKRISGRRYVNG